MKEENKVNEFEGLLLIVLFVLIIPLFLLLILLIIPCFLMLLVIKDIRGYFQKRKFLKQNEGKNILCITNGNRMCDMVVKNEEIKDLFELVIVKGSKESEYLYDNFSEEFPQIVRIEKCKVLVEELRGDYLLFGKKKIKLKEFLGIIDLKNRMLEYSYEKSEN